MAVVDLSNEPLPSLPPRDAESHKGDYGKLLIIGGSRGMAGAPALAGMAALRSGAGLVSLAIPAAIQSTVASFEPSYMTISLGREDDNALCANCLDELLERADGMTAVALGPGLGTAESTVELVRELYRRLPLPLVVDADGLNALSQNPELLKDTAAPRILTPHPGEFARLTGNKIATNAVSRAEQAVALAQQDEQGNTTVVLKGHQTVVAEGSRYAVNTTGNPGMATGGTGDCLTGVIAALLAQELSPWKAARLGVHIHGLAGDLAAAELGEISLIASDLPRHLPQTFHVAK